MMMSNLDVLEGDWDKRHWVAFHGEILGSVEAMAR